MGEKILIVQTGFLGDVVLSTPVIEQMAQLYPGAELSFLTTPAARELVVYHPRLSEVLVFDKRGSQRGIKGLLEMAAELRRRDFSKAYSLHKSWRTAVLLKVAGIPLRYGFREAAASWLYSATVPRSDLNHEVLRNLAILRHCDLNPSGVESRMHIEVPTSAKDKFRDLADVDAVDFEMAVAIAPGSVWATKRWTVAGFTSVAQALLNNGIKVILIGGPEDAEIAENINKRVAYQANNLVGRCSLIVSAAAIQHCRVLLTNDSAPMHIASAVGVPVVSTWCATIPEFGFGPWGVAHHIHEVKDLACRPCGRHGHNYCPTGTHACQLKLSTADILHSVLSYIDRSNTTDASSLVNTDSGS